MTLRVIEISAPKKAEDKIKELSEKRNAVDLWAYKEDGSKNITTRILVDVDDQQALLDDLQGYIKKHDDWHIMLIPVEASVPKVQDDKDKNGKKNKKKNGMFRGALTREELYEEIRTGASLHLDYLTLVFLSTVVALIGLIEDNIAVVIGAMVIAPLLGPNLALAFGAALGDKGLIWSAIRTNAAGICLCIAVSVLAGFFFGSEEIKESSALMARTEVNFAAIALALASGAAAVLSMTTGVSSALVGVMVAVALIPPTVTLGLTAGAGFYNLSYGAFLLLATNVICINLSAQGVFLLKNIRPRTWYEKKKSVHSARINALIWLILLIVTAGLIFIKHLDLGF